VLSVFAMMSATGSEQLFPPVRKQIERNRGDAFMTIASLIARILLFSSLDSMVSQLAADICRRILHDRKKTFRQSTSGYPGRCLVC
jgi:hypothetical protein